MQIRTRIAPSPTGYIHIGTLRTVLWDYFLAKQQGGQFILRVEDTDQARLVSDALKSLLVTFQKLQIVPDEGPFLKEDGTISQKGEYGPYIQSERLHFYHSYIDQLVQEKKAYVCFCSKERLEEMRTTQKLAKQMPKYDRRCLGLSQEEIDTRLANHESHVIRMKIPEGISEFDDAIRGHISFHNSDVDDQVIKKADGFPTYHLAVVVDDHLMNITHVLRGEEWLPSTPKQIILHQMFGWDMPVYAHVPLLVNQDRSKLSKRKGDVATEQYLQKGYIPEALINFIATLGFNPTSDREIYSLEELIQLFDLSKVNKAGACVNAEKLDWMNNQYILAMEENRLMEAVQPFVSFDLDHPVFRKAVMIERSRVSRLVDFEERLKPYISLPVYDPAILIWKKTDQKDALDNLQGMIEFLTDISEDIFDSIAFIEGRIKTMIEQKGLQNGNVLWPTRVALSGSAQSPSPFELMWILGKEETLKRLAQAVTYLG